MQRLVLALVFAACSSPASPQTDPTKTSAPPPEDKKPDPTPPPETKVEPPAVVKFADASAVLASMPADVAGLADAAALTAYLERVKGVPGIGSADVTSGGNEGFGIKLDPAIDAATLAKQFEWTGAHAVSGDAEQKSFSVQLSKGELEGSKGKKIKTEFPRFGAFRVEARLAAKPTGKKPTISAGASPAYDVEKHPSTVQWLFFMRDG